METMLEEHDTQSLSMGRKTPLRGGRPPRVSIGIPVYNGERYISDTIDSIQAQTFRDFELIISDNASTDGTAAICRRYAASDARIRYFRNERNVGAAKNFNRLVVCARGEYFKWAASDNLIEPTFLERCVELLDARPDAVVAYTRCKQINEFDGTIRTIDTDRDLESADVFDRLRSLFLQVIGMQDTIWGLVRAGVLQKTRLIRSFVGADDCLLIELILQGPWVEVPEHLLVLRIHPGGYHAIDREGAWWKQGEVHFKDFMHIRVEGVKQARWYDPENTASIYFPYWRRLREYSMLIVRSGHHLKTKLRMMWFLCHLVSWRRIMLAAEIWNGFRYIFHTEQVTKFHGG